MKIFALARAALASACLMLACAAGAVTPPLTPAQLIAQFAADLPSCTNFCITPATLRIDLGYIANSMAYLLQAASGQILVGNSLGVLTPVAMSGDATIANTGAVTVTGINGNPLGSTAPTQGNVLVGTGSQWVTTPRTVKYLVDPAYGVSTSNTSAQNVTAVNLAITAANGSGGNIIYKFPAGTVLLGHTTAITANNVFFECEGGSQACHIQQTASFVFQWGNAATFTYGGGINNIGFVGDGVAHHPFVWLFYGAGAQFINDTFANISEFLEIGVNASNCGTGASACFYQSTNVVNPWADLELGDGGVAATADPFFNLVQGAGFYLKGGQLFVARGTANRNLVNVSNDGWDTITIQGMYTFGFDLNFLCCGNNAIVDNVLIENNVFDGGLRNIIISSLGTGSADLVLINNNWLSSGDPGGLGGGQGCIKTGGTTYGYTIAGNHTTYCGTIVLNITGTATDYSIVGNDFPTATTSGINIAATANYITMAGNVVGIPSDPSSPVITPQPANGIVVAAGANNISIVGGATAGTSAGCSIGAVTELRISGVIGCADQFDPNTIPLTALAQAGANTMVGNWTGSTANEVANTMPSCSDSTGNHLNYVSGTGITCGTTVGAAAAGTLTGTTLAANVVTSSLTTVGTIGTGTWQGTVVTGQFGGTGVNNSGKTITLGGNLTTSGAFATTLTVTAATNSTMPAGTHTLGGLDVVQTWSAAQSFASGDLKLNGTTGSLTVNCAATCGSSTLTLPGGTTDFSATGGTSQVVKQTSSGGALTVAQLAQTDLSDYTASTWTPALVGAGTAGTFTYTSQVGSYEKIGRHVTVRFNIVISATSVSPVGALSITGLPVTAANTTGDLGGCYITGLNGFSIDANYNFVSGIINPNTTAVIFNENSTTSGHPVIQMAAGNLPSATPTLQGVCEYHS